ncbi:MAG: hypothetical protein QXF45_03505 [Candidatus Caldarchaeum sp.]
MEPPINESTILVIIWFFIGFGVGVALLKFWKVLLVVVLVAVLLPIIVSLFGMTTPFTPEQVINAFVQGINLLANVLGANPYSALGFVIGLAVGLVTYILRLRG